MDTKRREVLLKECGEVGSNFRSLTDIRFKLLAFLPIVAAASAALKGNNLTNLNTIYFSPFGFVITLGLTTYNARNEQLYDELVGRAVSIERSLCHPDGAFGNRPRSWLDVPFSSIRWSIDHRTAITIYQRHN